MNFGSTIEIGCRFFFNVSDFCNRVPDVLRRVRERERLCIIILFLMIVVTAGSHFYREKEEDMLD